MRRRAESCLDEFWPLIEGKIQDTARRLNRPVLIGVGGQGGSGKSTFSHWLAAKLSGSHVLPLDDYRLPREVRTGRGLLGSHPDGNDLFRLHNHLDSGRKRLTFDRPVFCTKKGRAHQSVAVPPVDFLICDGEIAAHDSIRPQFDLFILIDSHWRTQLNARLTRDMSQRAYDLEKAIEVFLKSNLRDFPRFAADSRKAADIILYRNSRGGFTVKKPLPQSAPR